MEAEHKNEADWKMFAAAVAVGTQNLRSNAAKFADEENVNYQIIDIDEARRGGIMPSAYQK